MTDVRRECLDSREVDGGSGGGGGCNTTLHKSVIVSNRRINERTREDPKKGHSGKTSGRMKGNDKTEVDSESKHTCAGALSSKLVGRDQIDLWNRRSKEGMREGRGTERER